MDNRTEFEFKGRTYAVGKLSPMKQFHVVRRLGPLLGDLLPAMKKADDLKRSGLSPDQMMDGLAEIAGPVLESLSKLSDKDSEFALYGLLETIELKQESFGGSWARVCNGNTLMVQDLEMPALLFLAWKGFERNLGTFFPSASRQ